MSTKFSMLLGMTVGSIIGGYIPTLWGVGFLSFTSVIFSGIGGLLGVIIMYKLLRL